MKMRNTKLALILAALAMLGPFSIDAYLPAFPSIQSNLNSTAIEVQQTLTAYLLSFAFMSLWHGALSDSFGRRNIILVALLVFAVASFGCATAYSVEALWVFRILQGVSAGAGMVIGRAIVRDLYDGAPAERLLSMVTMLFSIAPAIAPMIGGWIVSYSNWRNIFYLLVIYTILVFWACWKWLPESLALEKRQAFNMAGLWRNYKAIFTSPRFHFKAAMLGCNFGGLFLYIASAPVFVTEHLKLGIDEFAWQFIPMVGGIFLGALAANRLAGKITVWKQIRIGFIFLLGSSLLNVIFHFFFAPALPWSVLPLFFYAIGNSLIFPGATLLVLDLFPDTRGIAASCQSTYVTLIAAIVAGVMAPLLSYSVLALALGQLSFAIVALLLWQGSRWHKKRGVSV
jgi:DHA1 family bicyclomycin/chloramphenicol resistance-like MFS transporter